ncbi:MAG: cyclic nucleotide-binding domain-containing protein, partial [Myxococcales bacterium]
LASPPPATSLAELQLPPEDGWFASPEGATPEAGAAPEQGTADASMSLVELDIASVDEEEEIEILTVSAEVPDAAALPEIPLFSDLSREAFIELASQCDLRRPMPGELIVEEGSVGTSFFVLCAGTVKVCKKGPGGEEVVLARLSEGAFFGEMALLSGAPRAASVIAEDDAECLEISAALLAGLQKRYPHVAQVLKKFCRQRLLANVMATSPLFRPFDKADRKALVEKFKARDVAEGEKILEEGKVGDGLYVVMSGEVEVRKVRDGAEVPLAQLKEGELFGEISLLTKSAATASVAAKKKSTVLRLPRATFDELISTHPQILMLVSELSDERLRQQQATLAQSAADGDYEDLMLV